MRVLAESCDKKDNKKGGFGMVGESDKSGGVEERKRKGVG